MQQHYPQTPSTRANPRHTTSLARFLGGALTIIILLIIAGATQATAATTECPNQALRTGPSANLPDCRAYELVTPSNTDGRNVIFWGLRSEGDDFFSTDMSSPSGESFVYGIGGGSLSEPSGGNGVKDVYEAKRNEQAGWLTVRRLSPSGTEAVSLPEPGGISLDHEYAFAHVFHPEGSPDFSLEELLAPGEEGNFLGGPDGSFVPVGVGSLGEDLRAEGRFITSQGTHIIFTTGNGPSPPLEPTAPPAGTAVVYDRSVGGQTHVVSLLPGNVTPNLDENAEYEGNSADGSVVVFKIGTAMYARVDNAETVKLADNAVFAGISETGSFVFYVIAGNAYRYDTGNEQTTQITATNDAELVNVSSDGSRVYFVSHAQIGGQGVAGQPNLYVWDAATATSVFIATVAPGDLAAPATSPFLTGWTIAVAPSNDPASGPGIADSRTTPDGSVLAFRSRAKLTGYENGGHAEIYRYDARTGSLACVSCSPLASPAGTDARFHPAFSIMKSASVVRNLSGDGDKVFFETAEALVSRDADGSNDIYEWSVGAGGAEPSISLITSGQTPAYVEPSGHSTESNFLASVTPDGSDVFFLTQEALTDGAPGGGARVIYDARVNGGFASPAGAVCEADACQGEPSGTSVFASPASAVFRGAGDLTVQGSPVSTARSLTRAQRLARALKACKRQPKRKRSHCQAQARKHYGATRSVKGASRRVAR